MTSVEQSKDRLIRILVNEMPKWVDNFVTHGYDMSGFAVDLLIEGDELRSDRLHIMMMCDWRARLISKLFKALNDPEHAEQVKDLLKDF